MTHLRTGNDRAATRASGPPKRSEPAATGRAVVALPTIVWPAGLTALLVYLALTPLPPFAADVYGSLVRRYAVLGAVMFGYLCWLAAARRMPRRTVFDLPLAALTFAVLFAVYGSADRRVSVEHVLPLLPAVVLFYLLHDLRVLRVRALAWSVVLAGAVVAVVALSSVWRTWGDWWTLIRAVEGELRWSTLIPPQTPRVAGAGNHPNVLGAVFAISLPVLLFLGFSTDNRRTRGSLAGTGLLIGTALFFTLSRAAWAGAVAGLLVSGAGYAIGGRGGGILWSRRTWIAVVALSGIAALIAGWLLVSGARPEWLFRDSLGPRADMRRAGWEMFLDNPLTGVGPGLYVALYPLYGGAYPFAAVHSHNVVVQTAVDTGLLGLAAGAMLLASVALALVRGLRHGGPEARRGDVAATAMLTAGLIHALADSPQLFPEVLALAIIALVIIARGAEVQSGPPGPDALSVRAGPIARVAHLAGWIGPGLAVLLALALPVFWLVTSRAHQPYSESVRLAGDERWPEAVAAAELAVARDEHLAAHWFQLGAAHASTAIDGDRRAEQQAALDAIQRGLLLESHNGAALVDYAALNVALDRPEAARAVLPALARLAGRDSLLLLAHATLTQWTSPPEQAIETFAGLLVINPTLAATPYWQDGGFRERNFDAIVDRALARVSEVAGEGPAADSLRTAIAVYAGRAAPSPDQILAALAARPDDVALRIAAGRLLMASDTTRGQAYELLRGAVRLKSDDPAARAALGDWYALAGDLPAARRQWAAASYLGDLAATVALGNSYPPDAVPAPVRRQGERLLQAAEIGRFYLIFQTYRFTFMRAEPIPIILPGDWLLALPAELEAWQSAVAGWGSEGSPR